MTAMTTAREELVACHGLTVSYGSRYTGVIALAYVDLTVRPHQSVALRGPSGSGKTTLLHALGGLVKPSAGTVSWKGELIRARGISYVFQNANLLPHFTAFENVAFAVHASSGPGAGPDPAELLSLVGLPHKLDALPSDLSGGEAQRVAIARALGQRPELLLCDEPTGHLDSDTGGRVLDLIDALRDELRFAIVTATHDTDVAARYERRVELRDGRVIAEETYQS